MKVLHVESGLGNQMLDYTEYLAVRKSNPNDDCYIETILSEVPQCGLAYNQWNGYELDGIFANISCKNIKARLSEKQWEKIITHVKESRFWEQHWNYAPYITEALNDCGFVLKNCCRSHDTYRREDEGYRLTFREWLRLQITLFFRTKSGNRIKRVMKKLACRRKIQEVAKMADVFFETNPENMYLGHELVFMYKGAGIERIDREIRESFRFPDIIDPQNMKIKRIIRETESVAIHVRRGDMLKTNFECYEYGYFKRAVKHMKKKVQNPFFFFFCDSDSEEWVKNNIPVFGLDLQKDNIFFVDWNSGKESYRDMQLMAMCRHNIITTSSFGWWGAYLNENPEKITISPDPLINTTYNV